MLRMVLGCALIAASAQAKGADPLLRYQTETPAAVHTPQKLSAPHRLDRAVRTAGLVSPPPVEVGDSAPRNDRRLLSPTKSQIAMPGGARPTSGARSPRLALPKIDSFTTAGAGLAIVVGLFLACMWMLRRSGPKATSPLPQEAVAVLGRVPLAARNFAHLLQVGNKLVLVAITPEGVSPITEITDPIEVQRVLGLCMRNHKQSTTAEFHNVLQQLSKEPASGFLGNDVAASYASHNR